MIVITIEMWPYGYPEGKYRLAQAFIRNTGGNKTYGNYDYVLQLKTEKVWRAGTVVHFNRAKKNVWWLLKAILHQQL